MADVKQLMVQLDDSDVAARAQAAEQLCRLGEAARPAATALVQACSDASEDVREHAVAALEELGSPAAADLDTLTELAGHEQDSVAYWAVTLLGRAGEGAQAAVSELVRALASHPAASVRQRAAWALGKIGPAASAALDDLRAAATADDPRLVRLAQRAIDQIGA